MILNAYYWTLTQTMMQYWLMIGWERKTPAGGEFNNEPITQSTEHQVL